MLGDSCSVTTPRAAGQDVNLENYFTQVAPPSVVGFFGYYGGCISHRVFLVMPSNSIIWILVKENFFGGNFIRTQMGLSQNSAPPPNHGSWNTRNKAAKTPHLWSLILSNTWTYEPCRPLEGSSQSVNCEWPWFVFRPLRVGVVLLIKWPCTWPYKRGGCNPPNSFIQYLGWDVPPCQWRVSSL